MQVRRLRRCFHDSKVRLFSRRPCFLVPDQLRRGHWIDMAAKASANSLQPDQAPIDNILSATFGDSFTCPERVLTTLERVPPRILPGFHWYQPPFVMSWNV